MFLCVTASVTVVFSMLAAYCRFLHTVEFYSLCVSPRRLHAPPRAVTFDVLFFFFALFKVTTNLAASSYANGDDYKAQRVSVYPN